MKWNRLVVFFMVTSVYMGNAQILKPVPIDYSQDKICQRIVEQPINIERSIIYADVPVYSPVLSFPACNFKCTLPQGAVFCRMEDAIYKHLNFWVKFRMGTDDRYSN
jgi:hypothetical protein